MIGVPQNSPHFANQEKAARLAKVAAEKDLAITVGEVWPLYMEQGRPLRKAAWKPRYRADLEKAAAPGGVAKKRGKGETKPGHLAALMGVRLVDVDSDRIRAWYADESKRAPVQAGRAVAMFSGFLRWCAMHKDYRKLVDRHAAKSEAVASLMPPKVKRADALSRAQLAPWFAGTKKLRSRAARAYLQALVLTGARREEMAALKWADIDFRWQKLTLADKVGEVRVIPLTDSLARLLADLPRAKFANGTVNPYAFASSMSVSGRIVEPRAPHGDVLTDASIPHLTIHGLRRTFALTGGEAGAPAGAIAQIMGHRPSAVAEGYKPRTVDQLRGFMVTIERFILDAAGVEFAAGIPTLGGLRVVK